MKINAIMVKNRKIMILTFFTMLVGMLASCTDREIAKSETVSELTECTQLFPPLDTIISTHSDFTKTHYPVRISAFQADTVEQGDIVMLGNSLTEQGGNWGLRLNRSNVKNRGISGDNTEGVLARLNELLCRKPSAVFLMIGTNDLWVNHSAQQVAENIDSIGSILAHELPDSRIFVQTVMPLELGIDRKTKLLAINELLRAMEGRSYKLLDTFVHMADDDGDLPADYTHDGVHLTSAGYDKWGELLVQQF